ncbi:cation diffusion facilitator family transporter [Chachezhania antarctica]|uniref:cation diffusion facilitator family transporter n=1 Tax=Chachezhania antarctica TaxID=2340860 RepID=UPI000EABDBFA|nr:cation diffusion facilitator family transporter [Chachezhania antarctica]
MTDKTAEHDHDGHGGHDHGGHGHGGHGHGHGHHHHHHIDPSSGDARIIGAVIANFALTIAQIIGGILSGSLALIADALHNMSDAMALVIAFAARKIARRPASEQMSFGYGRAEVVAALINYVTLIIVALYLVYEGIMRFFEPEPVAGWIMVIIAGVALVIDLATAALTYTMAKTSMNIRAAFLHNVADALGSVAVIVAGTLVILYGWTWVDPLVTLMISAYILWHVQMEIGGAIRVLMLGTPGHLDFNEVVGAVRAVPGVTDVHHVHLWQMQENDSALDAHVIIDEGAWGQADGIKAAIKDVLKGKFDIGHSTLELECAHHACDDPQLIGHG